MSQCPHCEATEDQTTYGRTARGSRRYKCRARQRVYTPEPLPLGDGDEVKREAARLYLEGTDFRRIGRALGVDHQSVINWVNAYHPALPAAEPPAASPGTPEMDELFTFAGSKKAGVYSDHRGSGGAMHRGLGRPHEPHARVDAAGRGLGAARPELLLRRPRHVARTVPVGRASGDVRRIWDLLGGRHERRPSALPGAAAASLTLLLALHPGADEGVDLFVRFYNARRLRKRKYPLNRRRSQP